MKVRTMTPDDENRAIDTIALGFAGDPMTRWVWPHAHQYLAAMPRFVRAFGGAAFSEGGAFCSEDYAGAALWLRPGVHPDEERLGELMESTASAAAREALGNNSLSLAKASEWSRARTTGTNGCSSTRSSIGSIRNWVAGSCAWIG